MQLSSYRKIAVLVGVILSLISAIFTIRLLAGFAQGGGFERVLFCAFGASVQITQTLSYTFATVLLFRGQGGKAVPLYGLFMGLFMLSLVGTIGAFAVSNQSKVEDATVNDPAYHAIQERIKQIDAEMVDTRAQIDDFAKRTILTKGVIPARQRLSELMQARTMAENELRSFQRLPTSDIVYSYIGRFFSVDDINQVKLALYCMYAILLDLSAALLLGYGVSIVDVSDVGRGPVQYSTNTNTGGGGLSPGLVRSYGEALIQGANPDGSLAGRRRVADTLSIDNRTADRLHTHFKKAGLIKVNGTKTYPAVDPADFLDSLPNGNGSGDLHA